MARYIDADILYGKIYPLDLVDKRLYTINAKAVEDAIAKTPTADVAPKSDVIDEFVERLKNAPIKYSLPLFGLQTKEEIEEHFDGIMLQFGNAIDNIANEMKGE